jgi:hypothetical protein
MEQYQDMQPRTRDWAHLFSETRKPVTVIKIYNITSVFRREMHEAWGVPVMAEMLKPLFSSPPSSCCNFDLIKSCEDIDCNEEPEHVEGFGLTTGSYSHMVFLFLFFQRRERGARGSHASPTRESSGKWVACNPHVANSSLGF